MKRMSLILMIVAALMGMSGMNVQAKEQKSKPKSSYEQKKPGKYDQKKKKDQKKKDQKKKDQKKKDQKKKDQKK